MARHFDLPEERVREYIASLRDRAEEERGNEYPVEPPDHEDLIDAIEDRDDE